MNDAGMDSSRHRGFEVGRSVAPTIARPTGVGRREPEQPNHVLDRSRRSEFLIVVSVPFGGPVNTVVRRPVAGDDWKHCCE